jgi:hypothetical protein
MSALATKLPPVIPSSSDERDFPSAFPARSAVAQIPPTVEAKYFPSAFSAASAVPSAVPELPPALEERQAQLTGLRRLLAEKFPVAEQKPGGLLRTGLAALDAAEGGLRRSTVTELSGASGEGALFLHEMMRSLSREQCFAALVDAGRTFEPGGCYSPALARLLVVFCVDAAQAIKATDLLLRDGNLSLVLLDLQAVPLAQLRRIPASTWHRFQRLAEQTTSALVILTPQPVVESARVRIATGGQWTLNAQRHWRSELISALPLRVFPRHSVPAPAELCPA